MWFQTKYKDSFWFAFIKKLNYTKWMNKIVYQILIQSGVCITDPGSMTHSSKLFRFEILDILSPPKNISFVYHC